MENPIATNHSTHGMDNSGRGPLRVPGFGGLPIDFLLPADARFARSLGEWQQSPPLTAQELAMVAVMNWLTDKPAWSDDIFDDAVVAQWRTEMDHDLERIIANPSLMHPRLIKGETPWAWCVQELRDKAADFKKCQHVRVLDTGAAVCKADSTDLRALSATLRRTLCPIVDQCQADRERRRRLRDRRNGPAGLCEDEALSGQDGQDTTLDEHTIEALEKANLAAAIQEDSLYDIRWCWEPAHKGKRRDRDGCARMVSCLVDPMLFPLVYKRTPVLQDGGTVSLDNLFGGYGAAKPTTETQNTDTPTKPWSARYQALPCDVVFTNSSSSSGNERNDDFEVGVQIVSYINGLHPNHADLYRAIEKVLSHSIRPWNDCLVHGQNRMTDGRLPSQLGPVPARIITYGAEWANELPDWAEAFRVPSTRQKQTYQKECEAVQRLPEDSDERKRRQDALEDRYRDVVATAHLQLPPADSDLWQRAKEYLELPEPSWPDPGGVSVDDSVSENDEMWDLLCDKAERIVCHKHPEPGTAFSYQEWKQGSHGSRPIVDKIPAATDGESPPVAPPNGGHYPVVLQDRFRDQGLQVVVEIASIDLTPSTPAYAPDVVYREAVHAARSAKEFEKALQKNSFADIGPNEDYDGWRMAGRTPNDRIVAAAVFAFDVENISEPRLDFRQRTSMNFDRHRLDEGDGALIEYSLQQPARRVGKHDDYGSLAEILGLTGETIDPVAWTYDYQHVGSVALPQGRLVTFPDVLEHRLQPFRLVDATRPGRLRWLTLSLVDPHYRVCSTRNVPPQQHAWWAREVGALLRTVARLPQELVDQVLAYTTDDWPMGMDEAWQHREQMAKEGKRVQKYALYSYIAP